MFDQLQLNLERCLPPQLSSYPQNDAAGTLLGKARSRNRSVCVYASDARSYEQRDVVYLLKLYMILVAFQRLRQVPEVWISSDDSITLSRSSRSWSSWLWHTPLPETKNFILRNLCFIECIPDDNPCNFYSLPC